MDDEKIIIRYIETTGRCNLHCPVCVSRFRNFDMPMDVFHAIVDANEDILSGNWLWLDFNGEPLLDPFFFERVSYLRKRNIRIHISTNGLLLTEENCKKIIDADIRYLVVSVPSLDPENYYQMRGVHALDQVLQNILRLKQIMLINNSPMQLQAVAIDNGQLDTQAFVQFFHEKGIHAAIHQYTDRAGHSQKTFSVQHQRIHRGECMGRRQNLVILCDGSVVSCCCDFKGENSLGNIKDYHYSIKEMLDSGILDEMLRLQREQVFTGVCKSCKDWIYFQKDAKEKYVTEFPFHSKEGK